MIYIRKGPFLTVNPDQWATFPMFLVVAIPAVYLYGGIFTRPQTGELRPWQAVHSVFGLIFVPFALAQFVDLIGGNPNAPAERLLDLRGDRGTRLLRGLPGGGARSVPARVDRGDHLLDRPLGQDPLRRDRRPLGRLPRIARHPGDRAARGSVVRVAHQPRRRRRGRQRDGPLRGSRPLEGVRARHRRRHRGGDRLRPRDHGDRQPESAQREHTADPDQQLLGHHAAAGLARPGRDRLADRHARPGLHRRDRPGAVPGDRGSRSQLDASRIRSSSAPGPGCCSSSG